MAVKVMIAPALVKSEEKPVPQPRAGAAEPKPKRRRSSVYDADGNEVFITLMCLKCHKMRPLSQFGLRKMADGAIRNQPWCRTCRAGASAENPKRRKAGQEPSAAVDPSVSEESSAEQRSRDVVDPGALAAQVVAALHGGRR